MKIFFDNIIFSLQQAGGISAMWSVLISGMLKQDTFDCRFIEYSGANNNIFRKKLNIPPSKIIYGGSLPLTIERCRTIHINDDSTFLFHSSYYRIADNKNAINIVTIHDFTHRILLGSPFSIKKQLFLKIQTRAIKCADKIICVSKNTYNDLFKFHPDTDEQNVSIIYNGIHLPQKTAITNNPENSILFVGARTSYKNFNKSVHILSKTKFKLIICGAPLSVYERLLLDRYLGNNKYEVHTYPKQNELANIYTKSFCLLYPSSYEGFGIPVIEAQAYACPVIALNRSSIPEIIGDSRLLLSELNYTELVSRLSLLENQSFRKDIINCGIDNASFYTADRMTNAYLDIYIQAATQQKK